MFTFELMLKKLEKAGVCIPSGRHGMIRTTIIQHLTIRGYEKKVNRSLERYG